MENITESWTLTQVGMVVKDVEKIIERLTEIGIGPFDVMALPPEREEYFREKRMDADFDIRSTRMGNVQLELIQPLTGDSPHKEFLETKGEGIQHVMYQVDNLEETVARLKEKGVEVLLRAKFPGGGGVAYMDLGAGKPEPRRQHGDKDIGIDRVEQDLEDRVEGHEPGAVLGVATRQLVPHDDHGDAAGQTDQDQTHHVFMVTGEKADRQQKHEDRADHPVLHQRQRQDLHIAKYPGQLFITDLGQGRVHHQDQARGDGDRGRPHVEAADPGAETRPGPAQQHAGAHGEEDPQREPAVQQ